MTCSVTIADIRALPSGEFASVTDYSDAIIQSAIDESVCFLADGLYGDCGCAAHKYISAHILSLSVLSSSANTSAVASESADGMSRSYAVVQATGEDVWLSSTAYGRMFSAIIRRQAGPAIMVI